MISKALYPAMLAAALGNQFAGTRDADLRRYPSQRVSEIRLTSEVKHTFVKLWSVSDPHRRKGSTVTARRLGEFVLYILIGLAFASAILWTAAYTNWSGDEVFKWVGLVCNTLVVFGFTIQYHRRSIRRLSFWGALGFVLLLHSLFFILPLRSMERFPYSWWIVIMPVEFFAIGLFVLVLGYRPSTPRQKKANQPRRAPAADAPEG